MRETDGLEPMWEENAGARGGRVIGIVGGVARRVAPHLLGWASAQNPKLTVAWGRKVFHVRRDGVVSVRREGDGWGDNPRRNYNDAVQKRQEREASAADVAEDVAEEAPEEAVALSDEAVAVSEEVVAEAEDIAQEPPADEGADAVDLSPDALEAAVRTAMGIEDGAEGSDEAAEVSRDPERVKAQLSGVRSLLQALDDVKDYDLVEAVDEELYQLHKAVEYKLRNHKASEAKAQLDNLFK